MLGRRMQAPISTRTILVGVLIFNVVAIALSEVQRRSLVDRTEQTAINLVQSRNREAALEMDRLQKVVNDLNSQMKAITWSAASLRIVAGNSLPIDKRKLEAQIVDRLNSGKAVVVLFEDDAREDRDKDGRIRCGAGTEAGYLGAFVAGERYTIAYDRNTGEWTGTGAAQTLGFDPASQTCKSSTSVYGRKELKADVQPGKNLVLWGAQFQLDGLDVMRGGQKVGSVAWFD